MKKTVKGTALIALSAGVALIAAGCTGGATNNTPAPADTTTPVTMTFWHNSTTGDGKKYWDDTVAAYKTATGQ